MSQLENLTILVDAARSLPETKHLRRALRWADKRLEVLSVRKKKRAAMRERRAKMFATEMHRLYMRFKRETVLRHLHKLPPAVRAKCRRIDRIFNP